MQTLSTTAPVNSQKWSGANKLRKVGGRGAPAGGCMGRVARSASNLVALASASWRPWFASASWEVVLPS